VAEGTFADTEALLALDPIQRAKQKSKKPKHQKKNVLLNGLQTTRQKQYSWLEIGCLLSCAVFRGMGVDSIPLSSGGTHDLAGRRKTEVLSG